MYPYRVFISYAREDRALSKIMADTLQSIGLIPYGIRTFVLDFDSAMQSRTPSLLLTFHAAENKKNRSIGLPACLVAT
jgi:hypothetical protein